VGTPVAGDTVLLNVAALALGLGTGGHASVVALPDRLPSDVDGPGHLVKARYTPLQVVVAGRRRAGRPTSALLADGAAAAPGPPVVAPTCTPRCPRCSPACCAARPGPGVAYVMTDGGALPLWLSRTVAASPTGWSGR
jgi:hypothetical protein